MSYFSFLNVAIKGIAAAVPKNKVKNAVPGTPNYEEMLKFVTVTGVEERRSTMTLTASDLCCKAAENLLNELGWKHNEVDAIVFVSEGRDYAIPSTSSLLQAKLNLSKETYCVDLTLGCSGWVYGLNYASSLLTKGQMKKVLLLAGGSKQIEGVPPVNLFGHAGSATALEYEEGNEGCLFNFGTDGSRYNSIIVPDGACRNLLTINSWDNLSFEDGQEKNGLQLSMKGLNVFSFSVKEVPKSIIDLAEHFGTDYRDCDYLVLHQANKIINETIMKTLHYSKEKCPFSIYKFGNTSSASIPLTIVTNLKGKVENRTTKFLCSGFGVGFSWGSTMFSTYNLIIPELIEMEEA